MFNRFACWLFGHDYMKDENHETGIRHFDPADYPSIFYRSSFYCKRCAQYFPLF